MTEPGAAAWRYSRHTGWTQNLQTPLRRFLRTETGGAAVLLAATLAALAWANDLDQGCDEPRGVGTGEAGTLGAVPLHRGADRVPFRQVKVVAHADLLSVADDRGAGHAELQAVGELDASAVAAEHRRQTPANAPPVQLHAGSGANSAKTSCRSASVSRPRSISSWLRRNVAHWPCRGRSGSSRSVAATGRLSRRASASTRAWLRRNANTIRTLVAMPSDCPK
jgi:hypothetical protein